MTHRTTEWSKCKTFGTVLAFLSVFLAAGVAFAADEYWVVGGAGANYYFVPVVGQQFPNDHEAVLTVRDLAGADFNPQTNAPMTLNPTTGTQAGNRLPAAGNSIAVTPTTDPAKAGEAKIRLNFGHDLTAPEETAARLFSTVDKWVVLGVKILVNDTDEHNDDYVVKTKGEGTRQTPARTPAGETDNHIPAKLTLRGPTGFSCKVPLTVTGVSIKKTDDNAYPAEGETLTVDTDYAVKVYGTTASLTLDAANITAKTDKTGAATAGTQNLTVIWIDDAGMTFRGSDSQGDPLTTYSMAWFSSYDWWRENMVGKILKNKPGGNTWASARWQMEIKYTTTPNEVMHQVIWDIRREASGVTWGPSTGTLTPAYWGGKETGWVPDDPGMSAKDIFQDDNLKQIVEIDGPGSDGLSYTAGYRFSMKAKFQDWVEVNIGGKWYVCSNYKNWYSIMHVKYKNADEWEQDSTKTNEIVEGYIGGWPNTWTEE